MDSYAAHKHKAVKVRSAANPRMVHHLTPTNASKEERLGWLFLTERQALPCGNYRSVRELNA